MDYSFRKFKIVLHASLTCSIPAHSRPCLSFAKILRAETKQAEYLDPGLDP
jgi:hypothetical protein